ncbi:MAG: outer membrane protein assembly factor BamE [Thermodesulfobacteriota bacterium]
MRKMLFALSLILIPALSVGCQSAAQQQQQQQGVREAENLTVGKVQKEIRVGMPSAEVAEVLGSPNVVTTDEQHREVWVYDKMATESVSKSSSIGAWLIVFGAGSQSSAASKSQRTLTVIIKFDENGKVRDFAYRQSSF